jgi:phosphoribosylformimino-5-aminoimidazole carboxamide ribotide isomerase
MALLGVRRLIHFKKLVERFLNADIIASGGVSCIDDITKLKKTGVKGVIFGKSFYEEKITVEELQDFSQKS